MVISRALSLDLIVRTSSTSSLYKAGTGILEIIYFEELFLLREEGEVKVERREFIWSLYLIPRQK